MPLAPPRLCSRCRKPGCSCQKQARQQSDRERGTAAERGYDYQWQQFRLRYLADHPLCEDCQAEGLIRPATDIHHEKKLSEHPEYKYDEEWLMPLCHECHAVRTA